MRTLLEFELGTPIPVPTPVTVMLPTETKSDPSKNRTVTQFVLLTDGEWTLLLTFLVTNL